MESVIFQNVCVGIRGGIRVKQRMCMWEYRMELGQFAVGHVGIWDGIREGYGIRDGIMGGHK